MPSIFFGMDIAKKALAMSQLNLQVIAHNIANANTPGYSRQRAEIQTPPPLVYPSLQRGDFPQQLGTGVTTEAIKRIRDEFLDEIIRKQTGSQGYNVATDTALGQIEALFNEPNGELTLSGIMDNFFAAWQDLSNNPELQSTRANLREESITMGREFNRIDQALKSLRQDQVTRIRNGVDKINTIAKQIADLNIQITQVIGLGDDPNDLKDQRDLLIESLADIVPLSTIEQDDGSMSVLINGLRFIEKDIARELVVRTSGDEGEEISIEFKGGQVPDLSGGGSISAMMEMYEVTIPEFSARMDDLATSIVNRVNYLHKQGFGLDGMKGRAFFTDIRTAEAAGTVTFGADIDEDTHLDELGITAGNFEIMGTEIIITADDVKPAEAITIGELLDRVNDAQPWARMELIEESGGSKRFRIDIYNPVRKDTEVNVFRGSSSFLSVTGLDQPATTFLESNETYTNSADMISVSLPITQDLDFIAAAGDDGSGIFPGPGNNLNAIAISDLQSKTDAVYGATFADYYSTTISELGAQRQSSSRLVQNQEILLAQLDVQRESIKGVNLDEEAANMIIYQRIYEGAARVIQVVDSMLDTVINRLGI